MAACPQYGQVMMDVKTMLLARALLLALSAIITRSFDAVAMLGAAAGRREAKENPWLLPLSGPLFPRCFPDNFSGKHSAPENARNPRFIGISAMCSNRRVNAILTHPQRRLPSHLGVSAA
jgi:hypothetical protein